MECPWIKLQIQTLVSPLMPQIAESPYCPLTRDPSYGQQNFVRKQEMDTESYTFHSFLICQGSTYLKNLSCSIEHVVTDPHGRYIVVVLTIESQLPAIVNIYVPPTFKREVLCQNLEKVATFGPLKLLVAGDFNNILDYALNT